MVFNIHKNSRRLGIFFFLFILVSSTSLASSEYTYSLLIFTSNYTGVVSPVGAPGAGDGTYMECWDGSVPIGGLCPCYNGAWPDENGVCPICGPGEIEKNGQCFKIQKINETDIVKYFNNRLYNFGSKLMPSNPQLGLTITCVISFILIALVWYYQEETVGKIKPKKKKIKYTKKNISIIKTKR